MTLPHMRELIVIRFQLIMVELAQAPVVTDRVDSLMPLVYPSGFPSMSRLASPFHCSPLPHYPKVRSR